MKTHCRYIHPHTPSVGCPCYHDAVWVVVFDPDDRDQTLDDSVRVCAEHVGAFLQEGGINHVFKIES